MHQNKTNGLDHKNKKHTICYKYKISSFINNNRDFYMLKKIVLVTALLGTFGLSHAYQTEVGGNLIYIDPDQGDSAIGFGLDGTYYFNPVQVKNAPFNETAFLNRASNVNGGFAYISNDDIDTTSLGAGVELFVPNSDFYISADISHNETEVELGPVTAESDLTTYGAEVGYLPVPGLLLAAGLRGWDNDNDDGVDPTLRAKYVAPLAGNDINLEAYFGLGDLDEFSLRGDYYFDKTFSVGVDYYDNDVYDEFGINAKKFFSPQMSLEGRIGLGDDEDSFSVRAAYRF